MKLTRPTNSDPKHLQSILRNAIDNDHEIRDEIARLRDELVNARTFASPDIERIQAILQPLTPTSNPAINPLGIPLVQPQLNLALAGVPGYPTSAFPTVGGGDSNVQPNALIIDFTTKHIWWADPATDPPTLTDLSASGGTVTTLVMPSGFSVAGNGTATLTVSSLNKTNVASASATANSTADQNLQSVAFAAGMLNAVGRAIRVYGAGTFTTRAAQTPFFTFKVKLGGVTILTWVTNSSTAASTDQPWQLDCSIVCTGTGATGTVLAKGALDADVSGTPGSDVKRYLDTNTTASGAISLTSALTLQITVAVSTQPAADPRNAVIETMLVAVNVPL